MADHDQPWIRQPGALALGYGLGLLRFAGFGTPSTIVEWPLNSGGAVYGLPSPGPLPLDLTIKESSGVQMSDVKVCAAALERAAKDIGTEPIVREAVLRLCLRVGTLCCEPCVNHHTTYLVPWKNQTRGRLSQTQDVEAKPSVSIQCDLALNRNS